MQNMVVVTQLMREIGELEDKNLFLLYHELRGGHAFDRHVDIPLRDLQCRIRMLPWNPGELSVCSRFFGNQEHVASLIYQTALKNSGAILNWLGKDSLLEVLMPFEEPIGDALVQSTDWNHTFPASSLWLVIKESPIPGRLFQVLTAYPTFSLDEADAAWDAVDAWRARKRRA